MMRKWLAWIVDRFGLEPIWRQGLHRRVPKSPWYFGDGAALLMLLVLQVVTGVLMTLTYSPSPERAYESVRYITETQTLGWLVRAVHYWGAGMMVVMTVLHVLRQILVGGYKFPREGTWLVGVGLFLGVFILAFTGYTLRWDERAVYAIRVVLHMFSAVPLIGEDLVRIVQGGDRLSGLTLTRLYSVHVVLTPLILLGLTAYHLYLVVLKGTTAPAEFREPVHTAEQQQRIYDEQAESRDEGELFFPETWINSGRLAVPVGLIVVALAILVGPQDLDPKANLESPAMPREEWWFWWYSSLIAVLPRLAPVLIVLFPVLLLLAMLLLPFLDRGPLRGIRKRPVAAGFVAVTIGALLYLTNLRFYSEWTGWPRGEPPPLPEGAQLTEEAEEGRILFARYGCNSCHAIAGAGPAVGPDLSRRVGRLSREEIRRFVLRPPEDVPMPAYEGRISVEDLEYVITFVHVSQTFRLDQSTVGDPSDTE